MKMKMKRSSGPPGETLVVYEVRLRGVVASHVISRSRDDKGNNVGWKQEIRSQTHRKPLPFLACTLATRDTVVGRVGRGWWHGWR